MTHKFKVGARVITNGATPRDNTQLLLPKQIGTVVGYDTDGKNEVKMDKGGEPMFIADHELDKYVLTFADAEKMVAAALVGTRYEGAKLVECGGGDGEEDIKPFLIDEKEGVQLGATCFPEGGMLFWSWADEGNQIETESVAEAIENFNKTK